MKGWRNEGGRGMRVVEKEFNIVYVQTNVQLALLVRMLGIVVIVISYII